MHTWSSYVKKSGRMGWVGYVARTLEYSSHSKTFYVIAVIWIFIV
jgi:hypothetical protein